MKHPLLLRVLLVVLLLNGTSCLVLAQGEANNWYFGARCALTFNIRPPQVLLSNPTVAVSSTTSMSDSLGNLLFYSNGSSVYNRTHVVMPNGRNISFVAGGNSGIGLCLTVPWPGRAGQYFIFSQEDFAGDTLGYQVSLVDMSLRGGLGDVSASLRRQVFRLKCAPVLAAVRHRNGQDYWVITHDAVANRYRVYPITAAGLGTVPVVSNAGSSRLYREPVAGDLVLDESYLRASVDGKRLAFLPRGGKDINGVALFDLLDFDAATGQVSNAVVVTGRSATYCAFSPDGSKLYTSDGEADTVTAYLNNLVQYDLRGGSANTIAGSAVELSSLSQFQPEDMELGPDGRLYLAGSAGRGDSMAVVRYPNRAGIACGLEPNALYMGPQLPPPISAGRGSTSVPHFVSSFLYLADFTTAPVCVGDSARFRLRYAAQLDSVRWRFNDSAVPGGGSTRRPVAAYRYARPGTYRAQVQVYYNDGATDTLSRVVTVRPVPTVTLPATALLCPEAPLTLQAQVSANVSAYRWNTGATTPMLSVTQPGTYSLTVTAAGCTSTATTQVRAAPLPVLRLPADTLLCLDAELRLNGAAAGVAAVRWPDGSTGPEYVVRQPGPVQVQLTTTEGCLLTRTVQVRSQECPDQLVVPNIITPNGDGKNDGFQITGLEPGAWRLEVYNRWGRAVYEQSGYRSGEWMAAEQPAGVYYYRLTRPGQQRKGWVEVVR